MLIWLGDRYPEAGLCPAPGDPLRARYLRWMVYLPAAIYSMYWVRDEPSRLTPDLAAQAVMLERTAERIAHCWHLMDTQIDEPSPYLLGEKISMPDEDANIDTLNELAVLVDKVRAAKTA